MSGHLALVEAFVAVRPDEVARRLERLPPGDAGLVLADPSPSAGARVLERMAPALATRTLEAMPHEAATGVLEATPPDALAALLRPLGAETATRLIAGMPTARARATQALLVHGPDTAGGVMSPQVLAVPVAGTVADARTVAEAQPAAVADGVFAVGPSGELVGVIEIADLMTADPDVPLRGLVTETASIAASAPLKAAFGHHGWRDRDTLPVVTTERRLAGVLRYRRLRQVLAKDDGGDGERGVRTVIALGEIYWLGLCGLLEGIAAAAREPGDQASEGVRS